MAKEVAGLIKLQIPGGKANPSPPVGPVLISWSFVNNLMLELKTFKVN